MCRIGPVSNPLSSRYRPLKHPFALWCRGWGNWDWKTPPLVQHKRVGWELEQSPGHEQYASVKCLLAACFIYGERGIVTLGLLGVRFRVRGAAAVGACEAHTHTHHTDPDNGIKP